MKTRIRNRVKRMISTMRPILRAAGNKDGQEREPINGMVRSHGKMMIPTIAHGNKGSHQNADISSRSSRMRIRTTRTWSYEKCIYIYISLSLSLAVSLSLYIYIYGQPFELMLLLLPPPPPVIMRVMRAR